MSDINKIMGKYMNEGEEGRETLSQEIIATIRDKWREKKQDINLWLTKGYTKSQLEAKIKTYEGYIENERKNGGPKSTKNISGAEDVLRVLKSRLGRASTEEKEKSWSDRKEKK